MSKKLIRSKTYNVKQPKSEIELILESVLEPSVDVAISKIKQRSIEATIMDNEFEEDDTNYFVLDKNADNINDEVYQVFSKERWAEESEADFNQNEMLIERENEYLKKLLEIEAENEHRNKILEDEAADENLESEEIDILNENMMNEIANNLANYNDEDNEDNNEEEEENETDRCPIKSYTGEF